MPVQDSRCSELMVDKVTAVPNPKINKHIGKSEERDIIRLNQAALVFPGRQYLQSQSGGMSGGTVLHRSAFFTLQSSGSA
jgi:hypothetical protein